MLTNRRTPFLHSGCPVDGRRAVCLNGVLDKQRPAGYDGRERSEVTRSMDEKESTRELIVVDVKRYKKVKKALAESEERFRQLFENVPIGIYRTTPDGRIIDSNPALVKMLGYESFAELATRNLEEDFSDAGYKRGDFIKLLERNGEIKGLESVWKGKDGAPIHVRENAKLIRGEDGQVFFEGTVEDITESKLAEEAQRIRTQQMEILNCIISKGNMAESLADMLEVILDCVASPLAFDTSAIFMYDPGAKKMNLLASRGAPKNRRLKGKYLAVENLPFPKVLRGEPVFVDNAQQALPDLAKSWGWRMASSIPLVSKGRVIGALNMASRQRQVFSPEEKSILEMIGKEAGTLISKLQTETALRKSEKYYRTLIDTSPDIIVVVDFLGKLVMVNQRFLEIGGYFFDEVIGHSVLEFVPGMNADFFKKGVQRFMKTRRLDRVEYPVTKRDRTVFPLEMALTLLTDEKGGPVGIMGVGRDISERKRAEEQLRFLSSITENTSEAIITTDTNFVITYINKVAEKFFGYTLDELKGMTPDIFNAEPRAKQIQQELYKIVASGKIYLGESLNRRKDGSTFYCEYKVMPLKDAYGKVYAYSSVQRDISERKEAEAKLLAYQEQLRALTSELTLIEEKERRRIASELHDQIGQNLALCKLKVAALERDPSYKKVKGELAAVRRLLECSIQDARSLIFDLSPPVLYELGFLAALEWLAETIEEQYHVPVEFENRSGGEVLESDRQVILFQIVRELLVNVGKHSRAKQAKIILSLENEALKIQVNDDGIGFDAKRIYDAKSQKGRFGFFSMRERLQYLGGGLEVKSKPGQGSQIVLNVPRGGGAKEKP
jgi:PAS domain S-box-containing protein